eukprot:gene36864-biopygen31600
MEMFHKILGDKYPSDVESADYTILNSPELTGKHPALGLNTKETCDCIQSRESFTSPHSYDPNDIPVYAIVSGAGRGKTRYLYELQKELQKIPTILCVAITFSQQWAQIKRPLEHYEGIYFMREQREMEYAINIVSRIISMHYHIPFDMAYDLLIAHGVLSIDKKSCYTPATCYWDSQSLIMKCVEFIVNQRRERERGEGGCKVD